MCLDGLLCDEFDQKDVVFVNAVVRRMQTKNLKIMVIQILKRRSSIVVLIYTKVTKDNANNVVHVKASST
jgi:hypothetical protein